MRKIKIALLFGGTSKERGVSLNTGKKILEGLDKKRYEIECYDPKNDLQIFVGDVLNGKVDVVFPALHGPFGEDGKLQGMLDMLGVKYVFSGCFASALAMNKFHAKKVVQNCGLDVPKDLLLQERESLENRHKELPFPIVVKPMELGSSVGISIVKNEKELEKVVNKAFHYSRQVLLEQFISGRELTVSVMGNNQAQALPVIEIIPKTSDWFDYKAKYEKGASEEICPAKIPNQVRDEVQKRAMIAYGAINCSDLARADFIWDKKCGKFYFLEINTIPGMTETSLVAQAARVAGMEFPQFLDRLIEGAMGKCKSK